MKLTPSKQQIADFYAKAPLVKPQQILADAQHLLHIPATLIAITPVTQEDVEDVIARAIDVDFVRHKHQDPHIHAVSARGLFAHGSENRLWSDENFGYGNFNDIDVRQGQAVIQAAMKRVDIHRVQQGDAAYIKDLAIVSSLARYLPNFAEQPSVGKRHHVNTHDV